MNESDWYGTVTTVPFQVSKGHGVLGDPAQLMHTPTGAPHTQTTTTSSSSWERKGAWSLRKLQAFAFANPSFLRRG